MMITRLSGVRACALLSLAGVCLFSASALGAAKEIRLTVQNPQPIERRNEPITCGVPLAPGFVADVGRLALLGPDGRPVPVQAQVTGKYKDGSLRWVLLDFAAGVPSGGTAIYRLSADGDSQVPAPTAKLSYRLTDGVAEVDTGAATFRIDTRRFRLFDSVKVAETELIGAAADTAGAVLEDEKGVRSSSVQTPAKADIEDAGPLRVVLCVRGQIGPVVGKLPLTDYVCRLHFYAGKPEVRVFFTLRNPAAHSHPGNIWDLGSGGSVLLKDFSLNVPLAQQEGVTCRVANNTAGTKLYQDSSGGANWQSVNHLDKDYKVPVSFCGYRAYQGDKQVAEGQRIDGWLEVSGKGGGVAVGVREFWQNFPKALEFSGGRLRVGLWPGEFAGVHELLGGEQKTHEMLFVFHAAGIAPEAVEQRMNAYHRPMYAMPDADAVLASNAFWVTAPLEREQYQRLEGACDTAVRPGPGGPHTIQTKWEVIDEFDWRHFGDTFADNEVSPAKMVKDFPAHHVGGRPISHYVNEYDVIYTLMIQGLRRGDPAWMWMADVMSRHHADIGVYHTDANEPAYGHGSFMHTTHETAAYRSTFRAYPFEAKKYNLQYGQGGGPNAGHTYVVCLAQHYYLTGDRVSRDAFIEVANWAADSTWFNKQGMGDQRGFGNFLMTFVYAYQLTGDRKYYDRAMTLLGWIDKPFEGLGGNLLARAAARFLQMKLDNQDLDEDYRKVRDLLTKFADLYLTLPASRWERSMEQRCFHAEVLSLAYLYVPKENPNREKYRALGRSIIDQALDQFAAGFGSTKGWVMCFANTGAYLRAGPAKSSSD